MDKITSKFGVVSLDAPDTRLPIHTNKSGPDAVWDMIVDNAKYKGYTINRADYEVSRPYTPEGATSNRVTRVDITNKSDPLFKIGSESYIDYVRHDMSVADSLTLPYSHTTLEALIDRLNSTSGVSLSIDDFDVDYSHRDDGIWYLKSSDTSYFFTPGTYATLYDRGGWTKIRDWFVLSADSNLAEIQDMNGLMLDLTKPTYDVWFDALKYSQVNGEFNLPLSDLDIPLPSSLLDGTYSTTIDRKPLMEYILPVDVKYKKLTMDEYMLHSGSAVRGVVPYNKDRLVNFTTKDLISVRTSGNTFSYDPDTDTISIVTNGTGYNRIAIPEDYFGAGYSLMKGQTIKMSYVSTYREGTYWIHAGIEKPAILIGHGSGSILDGQEPIIGLTDTRASNIPLLFEIFVSVSDTGSVTSVLFINGNKIWEGVPELLNSTAGLDRYLMGTNGTAPYTRLDMTGFNMRIWPIGERPIESSYVEVRSVPKGLTEGSVFDHDNLSIINDHFKTHLTPDNLEDVSVSNSLPFDLVAKKDDWIIEEDTSFELIPVEDMSSVFVNTKLDGFDGYDKLGPGQQVSYIGYEYPDGRHTRYMGRVDDTEFFTPQEVMEAIVGDSGITYQIPYSTTQWFKYQLDGDIVYVPMKPLANHISYNELKALGVVNRSGDHLARVPANTVGNYKAGIKADYRSKIIHKDGRAYAVRMIKGLNKDGPMLPYVVNDSDNAWTHDSEWNRMFYNLARQTILPIAIGDNHASQKGPKWEFISAADLVVENNGSDARYTLTPEFTIEDGVAKPIYRGCYGVTYRGREGNGPDSANSYMGFRPMLRLLTEPEGPMKLIVRKMAGFHVVDYHPDTDLDYCHDTEVHVRLQGESEFTRVPYFSEVDGIYLLLTEAHMNAEVKFIHSNTMDTYETSVLEITEELLGEIIDHSQNGPGPALPTRLRYSDDVEGVEIAYFGRVSKEEFFSSGELRSAVGLTAGEEMDCVGWFKFSYCGDICYVPERPITHTINMNQLRDAGLRSGHVFTHEGQEYSTRVLRGTRFHEVVKFSTVSTQGDPITHRQTYALGSEWNELYYRLSDVSTTTYPHAITNDTYPVHVESQFERMTYDDLLMANNQDPGTFNLVYEDYGQDSVNSAMYRGTYGMSRFSHYNSGSILTSEPKLSFRPIVYLNRAALKSTSATNNFRPLAGSVSSWSQHTNSLGNPNRNMYNGFVYSSFISLMFGDNAPTEHRTHDRFTMSFGFSRRATSPIFRYGATVTRVGDEFYIIGGRNSYASLTFDRDIYVYNPSKDTYRKAGVFPVDISFHTATEVEGVIYIIGGHDGMYNTTAPEPGFNKKYFYTYDTVTGVIVDHSDREGLMVKYRHQTQYYNGKFYIFAGNYGDPSFIDVFDLKTGEFSRVDNPLHGLEYGYMLNNATNQEGRYMYVVAGWSVFNNARTNRAYEIDLETLTYRTLGNLPSAKSGASVMSMHGQIYVPAGWNGSGTTNIFRMGTMYDLTEANRVDD